MTTLAAAVERADIVELSRLVDGLADARQWERIIELRERCREAVERGRQLWGVAHWCTYRLALDAPAPLAGATLLEPRSPMLPGPITEVLGTRRTWDDLGGHLPDGPDRSVVAHEMAMGGDEAAAAAVDPLVVDIPPLLQAWEVTYPAVQYGPSGGTFHPPPLPAMEAVDLPEAIPPDLDTDPATQGLLELAHTWMAESAGRAESRCVEGGALDAIRAFGLRRALLAEVTPGDAVARMAWLAASGGAYGPRKGGAAGRSSAWWTAALLTGTDDVWPDPDTLAEAVGELRWYVWSDLAPDTGWVARLVVVDPLDGLAWALMAIDAR